MNLEFNRIFKAICFAFNFRDEVKLTRKIGSLRYFYSSAYFFSAIWVIMAAVVPQALTTGITIRRIFTTLSYCMVLRMTVTRQLPASIQMWYDTIRLIWKIEVKNFPSNMACVSSSISHGLLVAWLVWAALVYGYCLRPKLWDVVELKYQRSKHLFSICTEKGQF